MPFQRLKVHFTLLKVIRALAFFTLTLLASFPLSQASPKTQVPTYTLVECLKQALEANPQIKAAEQDIKASQAGITSAKAILYPTLRSSLVVQMEDTDVFDQQKNLAQPTAFEDDWIVTVVATQRIFSGGVNKRQIENAKLQNEITLIQLQEMMNSIVAQTRRAFYDVLLNEADIQVKEQQIELLRKELERQKNLFEAGRSTRFNIVRTEVRLTNLLPGLLSAQSNLNRAKLSLLELMGKGGDANSFSVVGEMDCPPYSVDVKKMIAMALERAPELSRFGKQKAIAERNAENSRSWWVPTVDFFVANRTRQDPASSPSFFETKNQATFGILGNWNMFDGFAGMGNQKGFEAQSKKLEHQIQGVARRIENEVRRAALNLEQSRGSLVAQSKNVKLAEESLGLAVSSADAGFSTQFDVLEATVDLSLARNNELRARHQYHLALVEIDRILRTRITRGEAIEPLVSPFESYQTMRVEKDLKLRETVE